VDFALFFSLLFFSFLKGFGAALTGFSGSFFFGFFGSFDCWRFGLDGNGFSNGWSFNFF